MIYHNFPFSDEYSQFSDMGLSKNSVSQSPLVYHPLSYMAIWVYPHVRKPPYIHLRLALIGHCFDCMLSHQAHIDAADA